MSHALRESAMLDPLVFVDLFAETYALLNRYTTGLSHATSLRQQPPLSICASWLVGHIVATRACAGGAAGCAEYMGSRHTRATFQKRPSAMSAVRINLLISCAI